MTAASGHVRPCVRSRSTGQECYPLNELDAACALCGPCAGSADRGPHRSPAKRVRWGEEGQGSAMGNARRAFPVERTLPRRWRTSGLHDRISLSHSTDLIPHAGTCPVVEGFICSPSSCSCISPPSPGVGCPKEMGSGGGSRMKYELLVCRMLPLERSRYRLTHRMKPRCSNTRMASRAALTEHPQFAAMVFMDGQHFFFCPALHTRKL